MRASAINKQVNNGGRTEVELGRINSVIASAVAFVTSFKLAVLGKGHMIYTNPQLIDESLTLSEGFNGSSVGPVTIAKGCKVTIEDGSTWIIL